MCCHNHQLAMHLPSISDKGTTRKSSKWQQCRFNGKHPKCLLTIKFFDRLVFRQTKFCLHYAFDPPFDSLPLQYSGCQENVLQKSIPKDPLHALLTLYLLLLCFLARSPFWIQSSVYLNRILFLFPELSHNSLSDTEVDDNEITCQWMK